MIVKVLDTRMQMAEAAAAAGASLIRDAIATRASARIILATGASQLEMLDRLVAEPGIEWKKVTAFHLDEYVGLPSTHPASFRKYLRERFVERLGSPLAAFHYIDPEPDAERECERLGLLVAEAPIDVAFVGIGENGHLAFNDPPADFDTERPYIVVGLDEACRQQQLGEGWGGNLDEVPRRAISMSIRQIMSARSIICTVPDERKAVAVRDSLQEGVTPEVPASILQEHAACTLFLDSAAASLLK